MSTRLNYGIGIWEIFGAVFGIWSMFGADLSIE